MRIMCKFMTIDFRNFKQMGMRRSDEMWHQLYSKVILRENFNIVFDLIKKIAIYICLWSIHLAFYHRTSRVFPLIGDVVFTSWEQINSVVIRLEWIHGIREG